MGQFSKFYLNYLLKKLNLFKSSENSGDHAENFEIVFVRDDLRFVFGVFGNER